MVPTGLRRRRPRSRRRAGDEVVQRRGGRRPVALAYRENYEGAQV